MRVTPQQVYSEVLAQGGSVVQAQVAAALVNGVESDGDPLELAGGVGPAQGLFQFEPGTWTGSAGGGRNGLPATVAAATWQQQITGFLNATKGNHFGAWGPDLVANSGNPNDPRNPSYGYAGGPQPGSRVANALAKLNLGGPAVDPNLAAYLSSLDPTTRASVEKGLEAITAQSTASSGSAGAGSSSTATTGTATAANTSSTNLAGTTYTGTAQQTSALSTIEANLQNYGFDPDQVKALTSWAWGEITSNVDPTQIAIDLQAQPVFQQVFPYFNEVNQSLVSQGQPALSVSGYLGLQQSYLQTAQAAGLPPGMLTNKEAAALMQGNVSPNELSQRLNTAMAYVLSTPDAQDAFNEYFGTTYGQSGTKTPLTLGQMTAIVLDPTKAEPLLQQQLTSAQIGGAATTSGVGALDAATATKLAQAGISVAQATGAFQNLAPYATLEAPRPGLAAETQGVVNPEQLATGALLGDTAAQRQLQTAVETAKQPFAGGGGPVSTSKGLVGAGSAAPSTGGT